MPRPKAKLIDQQPVARKPPLDPDVADIAPSDSALTAYDEEHLITYLHLLDADAESADWREVARIVLHIDPAHESDRARRAFDSHLSRAKWMTEHGYRHRYVVARPPKANVLSGHRRGWFDMRYLGAVLDHRNRCRIR
jgi:hypothetical protein